MAAVKKKSVFWSPVRVGAWHPRPALLHLSYLLAYDLVLGKSVGKDLAIVALGIQKHRHGARNFILVVLLEGLAHHQLLPE